VVNGLETVSFNVTLIDNGAPDIVQTAADEITLLTGTYLVSWYVHGSVSAAGLLLAFDVRRPGNAVPGGRAIYANAPITPNKVPMGMTFILQITEPSNVISFANDALTPARLSPAIAQPSAQILIIKISG
jgi:hypothetical protein